MPKQSTYDDADMYDLQVSWKRGSYVQIGVETHNGTSIADMLSAGGAGTTPADFTGLWGTFDEAGIDRIIEALQKAKRQAYHEQSDTNPDEVEV